MRDEFPIEVRRAVAARAGHRCSFDHRKPTSGPAARAGAALSGGIAAHITAAAPRGPRYDPSLSPGERRSADNAIWVCDFHARLIDRDSFTVEQLRGVKHLAEEAASREFRGDVGPRDESARLLELQHVTRPFELLDIIDSLPYTYQTTSSLRQIVVRAAQPSRLLMMAADLIPAISGSTERIRVAGILATLLSTLVTHWQPNRRVLPKLQSLCEAAVSTGDWLRVELVEPLAFALGAKGRGDTHSRVLNRLIEENDWRRADTARILPYYGCVGVEIHSIIRHWNDPFRRGLLRVNDVGRLIELMYSTDRVLPTPRILASVLSMLSQHAMALKSCGSEGAARHVNSLVIAFELRHSDLGNKNNSAK
jgi:hypothetical protein